MERVAQFVRHDGQEFIFGARSGFGVFPRALRFDQQALAFGFSVFAFGDVADVALNDAMTIFLIDIADEFHVGAMPRFGFQWQIFIANIFVLLQFSHGGLALIHVLEQTNLPQFLPQQLGLREP